MHTTTTPTTPSATRTGRVASRDGDHLKIQWEGTILPAQRSFSCLVEPEPGDLVLLAPDDSGGWWVLSILRRESADPVAIRFDRDCTVQTRRGDLRLVAADKVTLAAPEQVSVHTRAHTVQAREVRLFCTDLVQAGKRFVQRFEVVKQVGKTFDIVFDRFAQRLRNSYRVVEEVDSTTSREVDLRAEENVTVRSRNTFMVSEQLYKADAGQIHLG